jgi:hypothetical protein
MPARIMRNEEMLVIINALTAETSVFQWLFPCDDDGELHVNFAFNYQPADWKQYDEDKHGWIIWHNCSNEMGYKSPLTGCCSCHSPLPVGQAIISGAAYFGCEFTDGTLMVRRAMLWAKEKGIL